MKICIIVAMESEYALLENLVEGGRIGRHEVHLSRCGIGKVNAAVGAVEIIASQKPDLVISSGVAGAMSGKVHTGDFVVSAEIAYHDAWYGEGNVWGQIQGLPARFSAPAGPVSKAAALGAHRGLIVSGDRFVDTKADVLGILGNFPDALAVDMESGALAQVCTLKGIPFLSLRLISDSDEIARDESYRNFWQTAGEQSFRLLKAFLESI